MGPLTQLWLIFLVAVSSVAPGALNVSQPRPSDSPPAVSLHQPAPAPIKQEEALEPVVEAKSALLVDLPSFTTLYAKDPNRPLPIASLAKLMTALIVTERTKPDEVITVPPLTTTVEESQMGLKAGDQLRAEDLLAGALVVSGNDASTVLARHIAGSDQAFVKLMNERADELGLKETHFATPTGFDEGDTSSTAHELAVLSRAALAEPRIRALVGQKELKVKAVASAGGAPPTEYTLHTTDQLLGSYLPIAGLKTGTTDAAGPCLISVVNTGDRQLLSIVLNSPNRFQENKAMLDWGLRAFKT